MSEILAPAEGTETAEAPTDEKSAAVEEERATELPEKYRGKEVTDVIEMHQNSEKRLGELQNEVGQLRGLVTDLSALQRPVTEPEPAEQEPVNVSGDDLLSDPVTAIRQVIQPELDKLKAASTQSTADNLLQTEGDALLADYPDVEAIVSSEQFQTFAQRTPGRQADLNTAAGTKGLEQVRAARRLLEDFSDFQQLTVAEAQTTETPVDKARKVATEGSGTGAPISGKEMVYEADVIALIQNDKAKYLSPSFQKELTEAIKEGRFVKAS
jgi:hypothetical protein